MLKFASLLVFLLGAITFYRCLGGDFLNWDDPSQILRNPLIKELTPRQVVRIFTAPVKVGALSQYQPLVTLSYALEYRLFGLNPFPYHLDNLLLHLVDGILVFALFFRLLGRRRAALFGALLFLIHPLQVQSVGWAAARKDMLYTFFYLAALIAYLDYVKNPRPRLYLLSIFLFILSFLSKSAAVTFPLVLIVYDFWRGRRWSSGLILEKIPFFLLLALGVVLTFQSQLVISPGSRLHSEINWGNLLLSSRAVVFYLQHFIFPVNLSPFYPWPERIIFAGPTYILPFLVLPALLIVVGRLSFRKLNGGFHFDRSHPVVWGSLFFLVTILPVSRLVPLGGNEVVALRFMYLPIIGLCFLAVCRIPDKIPFAGGNKGVVILLLIAGGCFWALTISDCRFMRESRSYWKRVIRYYPAYDLAHHQLALAYYRRGDYIRAIEQCDRAIEFNPDIAYSYVIRGLSRRKLKDWAAARDSFQRGLTVLKKMERRVDVKRVEGYLNSLPINSKHQIPNNR